MKSHILSDDEDLLSTNCDSEEDWTEEDDDIPIIGTGVDTKGCKFLIEDLMAEAVLILDDQVQYKFENGHVELNFDTSKLPLLTLQALGLADVLTIVLELIFESSRFGAGSAPRCDVHYIKRDVSPVEPQPEAIPQPSIAAQPPISEPGQNQGPLVGPEETDDVQAFPAKPADSLDSDSDDDPMKIPKYKQPVVATVAYQLANIARKRLADEWPSTRDCTWQQAKEWIPQLHTYLSKRLATLGDHCIICDDKQPLAGIKPVACSKSLCSHQFDEMGYGASMDTIYHAPHVADLLISMAAAAANNPPQHRQRFFACPNPPSDFVDDHARVPGGLAIDPNNTMGIRWAELQQVLAKLPSVAAIAAAKDLQKFLNNYHKHAYRLVRWILSTCRGHIVELQPSEQIPGMEGRQFKLFTNTFERELAFQKLKKEQGSFYMFHGSPFKNWHSIMRTCLQNFSNTKYMTTGAASGAGVYTATNASTSVGYCKAGVISGGYEASIFGCAASCIALVEVAGNKSTRSHGIHVVSNHDAVVARYFFVYDGGSQIPTSADTTRMKIPAWDVTCFAKP